MSEWISVRSRRPPIMETSLGWNARANEVNGRNTYRLFCPAIENDCDITHWMPLPLPPENDNE